MSAIKKALAALYLISATAVLSMFSLIVLGRDVRRASQMLESPIVRGVLVALVAIVALGVLITVVRVFSERPEPTCVHPHGNPSIEVSLTALTSVARVAAADELVLVEQVEGRVTGPERDGAVLTVEAIALTETGLDQLAEAARQRVTAACDALLGSPGVAVRVRFLPSKTTTVTKEV